MYTPVAWQREDDRTEEKRKQTEREIAEADAMGRSDQVPGPLSIFENDRQREDLERAMVFAAELQAVVDKAEAIKRKKQRRDRKKDGIDRNSGSGKVIGWEVDSHGSQRLPMAPNGSLLRLRTRAVCWLPLTRIDFQRLPPRELTPQPHSKAQDLISVMTDDHKPTLLLASNDFD